jgi:hypothetical protein
MVMHACLSAQAFLLDARERVFEVGVHLPEAPLGLCIIRFGLGTVVFAVQLVPI